MNFFNIQKMSELLSKTKEAYIRRGIYYVIYCGIEKIYNLINFIFIVCLKTQRNFTFRGQSYRYFYHLYNTTWKNERVVEVPIIWEIMKNYQGKTILEVGNVLSHYFPTNHDILDKYEKADGVINQDIVDFQPSKKYNLIVSISTLEHVGMGEEPRDPKKIPLALENLTGLLHEGGEIVVTLPLGYNPDLDKLLKEDKICFTEQYHLKRISCDNKWIETGWDEVREAKFNTTPFPHANALIIGVIKHTKDGVYK
jgi:hypothetical protein